MKSIAFFETTKSEEHFLRKRIGKNFVTQFFPDPIQEVPVGKFAKADVLSVFIYSILKKDLIKSLKNLKLIAITARVLTISTSMSSTKISKIKNYILDSVQGLIGVSQGSSMWNLFEQGPSPHVVSN